MRLLVHCLTQSKSALARKRSRKRTLSRRQRSVLPCRSWERGGSTNRQSFTSRLRQKKRVSPSSKLIHRWRQPLCTYILYIRVSCAFSLFYYNAILRKIHDFLLVYAFIHRRAEFFCLNPFLFFWRFRRGCFYIATGNRKREKNERPR